DEPKFKTSIRQTLRPNVRSFYYLRLHGRNAAQWWKHEASEDRYNYLYSAEELQPFAEAAKAASREVKKAYLYANNHFSAKSVANATILKAQLGQEIDGEFQLPHHVHAGGHAAEDGVLPVEARARLHHHVELAVGELRIAGMRHRHRAGHVLASLVDLRHADRRATAGPASPPRLARHVPRGRVADLHQEVLLGAM